MVDRAPRWFDYIAINSYWFALTARTQSLTPLILPLFVQRYVGEASKGTYLGIMRLWALMVAVLVQALVGILSDHSRIRWGRRRPFIALGSAAELLVLVLVGLVANLEGMSGYWAFFAIYVLSMVSANTAHAAVQGLIPDLVPDSRKGLFSGVKALLELPLPMIFVSVVIARLVGRGDLWFALLLLGVVVCVCLVLALFAPERSPHANLPSLDWRPLVRLLLMTATFTLVILGVGQLAKVGLRFAYLRSNPGPLTGLVGLLAMIAAATLGVWSSVRIGLGGELNRHKGFAWWVVNRLICLLASTNLGQFMIYFLQERFPHLQGQSAASPAATVFLVVGVLLLAVTLPTGWLADRLPKRLLMATSGLIAAAGTFIVVLVPHMAAVYVGSGLVGAGMGIFYSASWALGTTIVPRDRAGQFLGLANLAGAGAGAIGAYIGGPLADSMSYGFLMGIYGALFLVSTVVLLGIEESNPSSSAPE